MGLSARNLKKMASKDADLADAMKRYARINDQYSNIERDTYSRN